MLQTCIDALEEKLEKELESNYKRCIIEMSLGIKRKERELERMKAEFNEVVSSIANQSEDADFAKLNTLTNTIANCTIELENLKESFEILETDTGRQAFFKKRSAN